MVFSKQKSDAQAFSPEAIKKIKDAFWGNHEVLVEMEAAVNNGEEAEIETPDIDCSYESGYENAVLFVCNTLGIDLEPNNEDSETCAEYLCVVHGKE